MLRFIVDLVRAVRVFFMRRTDLALEILALRQQVAVLKRKRSRPKLSRTDRLLWTALGRVWSRWAEVLLIVKPETVVGWHRAGFRRYWRWRSQGTARGRAKITPEIQKLIRRMARENPLWGAPKIHGELLKFFLFPAAIARNMGE
jgi:putative transposase